MINLKYTYQPSKNLDEVNKQVTNLVELLKNELLQAATNENVESLVMKVEQTSDDGAKRLAEVNARVGDTAAIVGMMASYNSATGKITVEAGLKAGIEESNIVLSGDHIILDGDVTIQNGFKLSGDHITANTITSTQIATATITANEIAGNTITAAEIASGAITADEIAAGAVTASKIASDYVYAGAIRANQITAGEMSVERINGMSLNNGYIEATYLGATDTLRAPSIKISGTATINKLGAEELTAGIVNGPLKVDGNITAVGGRITAAYCTLEAISSGTGADLIIRNSGTVGYKSGSSKRYKNSISTALTEEMNPRRLYDLHIVKFKYNTDYLTDPEDRCYDRDLIGFIAEEINDIYPLACQFDMEKKPSGWDSYYIIPPMLALIQEQNQRIKRLEEAYVRDN